MPLHPPPASGVLPTSNFGPLSAFEFESESLTGSVVGTPLALPVVVAPSLAEPPSVVPGTAVISPLVSVMLTCVTEPVSALSLPDSRPESPQASRSGEASATRVEPRKAITSRFSQTH